MKIALDVCENQGVKLGLLAHCRRRPGTMLALNIAELFACLLYS